MEFSGEIGARVEYAQDANLNESAQERGAPTLTGLATNGVMWMGGSQVLRQLLSLVSISILARHVPPSAYGLISMAAVVTNFLDTIRDFGTGAALIREPEVSNELLSTVFWVNCILGAAMTAVTAAIAWPAALFFHEPRLTAVLRVFSLVFLLMALPVVPTAVLTRRMAFRALTTAQVVGAVLGTTVAITLALHGGDVWSLVFGSITNLAVTAVMTWILCPWKSGWVWNWSAARHLTSFSLNLSGFNALNYFSRNADNLLVGRFLGSGQLGFYQMAYSLMTYPLSNFSSLICQVLFPAMAKVQNDEARFRSAYTRTCMLIALGTFPAMLGLTVTARPFVGVMLGARWMPVAGLLAVFGPLGMVQSVYTTTGLIYNSKGRADLQLRWSLISGTLYVASFVLGLHWGIEGVAVCYCAMWTLLMVPSFAIPFRLIGLTGSEFLRSLWPVLRASLFMAALAGLWLYGLQLAGIENAPVRLFSTAAVGAVFYLALMWYSKPAAVRELGVVLRQLEIPWVRRLGSSLAGY